MVRFCIDDMRCCARLSLGQSDQPCSIGPASPRTRRRASHWRNVDVAGRDGGAASHLTSGCGRHAKPSATAFLRCTLIIYVPYRVSAYIDYLLYSTVVNKLLISKAKPQELMAQANKYLHVHGTGSCTATWHTRSVDLYGGHTRGSICYNVSEILS